jgi:hypothetical protein
MLVIPITDRLVSPEKRLVAFNGSKGTAGKRQRLALFEEIIFSIHIDHLASSWGNYFN